MKTGRSIIGPKLSGATEKNVALDNRIHIHSSGSSSRICGIVLKTGLAKCYQWEEKRRLHTA